MSLIDKASLIQIPSGYKSTKLYSIEPTNGDGDFTFARSSSGTRVNSEGLIETASVLGSELVTNGDFATDSDWTKVGNVTIQNGVASFVDNGTNANSYVQQNVLTANRTYIVTFEVTRYVNGKIQILSGSNGLDVASVGVGTYKFQVESGSGTIFRIKRWGSFPNYNFDIDNVSVKEVFENDVPRLDYSGGASCASLLLEPQRTNLFTYSEDFSQTFWKKGAGLTITLNNAVSPDGSQTATKVQKTSQNYLFLRAFFATAIVGTLSVFVKKGNYRYVGIRNNETAGTAHSVFDFDTETFVTTASNHSLSFVKHENGWYRLIDYVSVDDNSNYQGIAITDVLGSEISTDIPLNSYVYVWGAQYEQNQSYPTSYIPTSGSTATRTADVCTNAGTSATFNSESGVLFAEIAALLDEGTTADKWIALSDGTSNNSVRVAFSGGANTIRAYLNVGGAAQADLTYTISDVTQYSKIAFKFKANDFALWVDGTERATDTSGSVYSANTLNRLAFDNGGGGTGFQGKTKQLMVFDEALSDEELSDLTGQVNLSFNNLATFYGYTIL